MLILEAYLVANFLAGLILLIAGFVIYATERTSPEPLRQPEWERAGAIMILFCWIIPTVATLMGIKWVIASIPKVPAEFERLLGAAKGSE